MTGEPGRRRVSIVLLWAALVSLVVSLPCVFLGILGLVGIVADVSPAENRQFGWQFLRLALIPGVLGVVTLMVALLFRRGSRRS